MTEPNRSLHDESDESDDSDAASVHALASVNGYIPDSMWSQLYQAVQPVIAAFESGAVSSEGRHVVQGFPTHIELGVITSSTTNPLRHAVQPSAPVRGLFPRIILFGRQHRSGTYRKGVSNISFKFDSPDMSQVTVGENEANRFLAAYLHNGEPHNVLKHSYFEGTDIFLITGYISVRDLDIDHLEWARDTNQKTDIKMKIRTSESQQNEAEQNDAVHNDAEQNDAEQKGAEQKDAEHKDAEQNDAEQKDAEHSDAEQNDAEQNDAEQNDAEQNDTPQVMLAFAQFEKVFFKFGKGPASAHLRKKRRWYCIGRFNDNPGPEKVEVWLRNV
jgi:hypothetical protein